MAYWWGNDTNCGDKCTIEKVQNGYTITIGDKVFIARTLKMAAKILIKHMHGED
jgi:hypothetical protein